ncbi:hypothetical protein P5V15_014683 [Pogonomyrmex californicus]
MYLISVTQHFDGVSRGALDEQTLQLDGYGFKFLEIGINVGPPSYVEIALEDHQGQKLILSLETWKGLHEQQCNFYKLLRNNYKDNFISVGPLTVRVCMMNNVRLESSNVRIMMVESTLRRMFNLAECIDITFNQLDRLVDTIENIRDSPTLRLL